jgi:hypothetical protein
METNITMQKEKVMEVRTRNYGTMNDTRKMDAAACCASTLLATCCEPSEKASCCGADRAANHAVAPRACGCSTSTGRSA